MWIARKENQFFVLYLFEIKSIGIIGKIKIKNWKKIMSMESIVIYTAFKFIFLLSRTYKSHMWYIVMPIKNCQRKFNNIIIHFHGNYKVNTFIIKLLTWRYINYGHSISEWNFWILFLSINIITQIINWIWEIQLNKMQTQNIHTPHYKNTNAKSVI